MYQVPVENIEKIRKARRAVKHILSEIGLEDCQKLLQEVKNENAEVDSDGDEAFEETEWVDFTDGYSTRLQKKWPYRSRSLCCNLCKYSSQNIYHFRSHVSRCHGYVQAFCALANCSKCLFIGHPKAVKKHMHLFHNTPINQNQPPKDASLPTHRGNERYQCRRCGIPNSSIFAMKKHIIIKHLNSLVEKYIGYRINLQGNTSIKVYCCKVCKVNTGTLDQMLHHMLVEPAHYSVSTQVQGLIHENKNYTARPAQNGNSMFVTFPSITPQTQQHQIFNSKPLVLPSNGQPARTLVALQQLQGPANSTTLICAPGTNQAFLPPQASALVQLASAEAKGLLQPGATIALRSALPQGPSSLIQLPTVSNVSLKQAPLALAAVPVPTQPQQPQTQTQQQQPQPKPTPQAQQIVVPSAAQANVAAGTGTVPKPAAATPKAPTSQITLPGTMLTSQSLLNHLIPTGNKVNGLPTYTFAPLQVAMPVSQSTSTSLKAVEQTSDSAPSAKKWVTCPLCNELFPSNVFDIHTEAAHQTQSLTSKSETLAVRAAFLKKMPDETIKCLTCKTPVSEKNVFQHLLHGLNCLYCSALFFSIKQLAEHIKQHNPSGRAYCEFLRLKFRIYSKGVGGILFPYFDLTSSAPKEVLGDMEVNLALVTNSLELIYFKLQPSSQQEICPAPVKFKSAYCPFCNEKFEHESKHLQHLKQKHLVAPTVHAILKTQAFKCIYCNGVYTGNVTQQAVMLHIQRCRCSPKPQQPPKPTAPPPSQPQPQLQLQLQPQTKPPPQPQPKPPLLPQPKPPLQPQPKPPPQPQPKPPPQPQPKAQPQRLMPAPQLIQSSGLYFLQVPQGMTVKTTIAPTCVIQAAPTSKPPETEAELQSKKRLEAALQKVIEDKKREREKKAALHKQQEQEKLLPPPEPKIQAEPKLQLVLKPSSVECRGNEESRDFISKYFHLNPYATKSEIDELCKKLSLSRSEVAAHFSRKRSRCMKSLKRNAAVVLLGFNMAELTKLNHNLIIPEQKPSDLSEEPLDSDAGQTATCEDGPEPMDVSEKVTEEVEQME